LDWSEIVDDLTASEFGDAQSYALAQGYASSEWQVLTKAGLKQLIEELDDESRDKIEKLLRDGKA